MTMMTKGTLGKQSTRNKDDVTVELKQAKGDVRNTFEVIVRTGKSASASSVVFSSPKKLAFHRG